MMRVRDKPPAMSSPSPLLPKRGLPNNDEDPARPITTTTMTPSPASALRKKVGGVRTWLRLDSTGNHEDYTAGKHEIMRLTGLPARDLRILDPILSYPSTVLGRERAIVINLEHIKAVITAQEVLLLNSKDPSVVPFVKELKKRISYHYQATKAQEGDVDNSNGKNISDLEGPQSKYASPNFYGLSRLQAKDGGAADGKKGLENCDHTKVLPFEFVVLEACLEAACSSLDNEAKALELEAHPALDKLTSKISNLNLERVRQIKSRLVAITGRVQKVRDELEHLLDDDEDMAEMYLTEKLAQHPEDSAASSMSGRDDINYDATWLSMDDMNAAEISPEAQGASARYVDTDNAQDHLFSAPGMRGSHGTHTSTTSSGIGKNLDVEELEMLLEAYFVQIEGTLNKLSTLKEYVDDTEDYINIMLDDKQNHLLQMGVTLTTATLVVTAFVVLVGLFGMNIHVDLFNPSDVAMPHFLWTVAGGTAGTVFLYVVAIAWYKYKGLLE